MPVPTDHAETAASLRRAANALGGRDEGWVAGRPVRRAALRLWWLGCAGLSRHQQRRPPVHEPLSVERPRAILSAVQGRAAHPLCQVQARLYRPGGLTPDTPLLPLPRRCPPLADGVVDRR